jgi:hypothetical protein
LSIREFRAFVDRIEGKVAVLLIGKDEKLSVTFPVECLPDGVGEGSVITVRLKYEPEMTKAASDEARRLIERLTRRGES